MLDSLNIQAAVHISLTIFLVDDGSTDDTGASVQDRFPDAVVIPGNGSLYWAGGMRTAFQAAMKKGGFDYYLWLNDDIVLDNGALEHALDWAYRASIKHANPPVLVGTLRDAENGTPIYGGMQRRSRWRRLYFDLVTANTQPAPCETCNGNFVLIPKAVANTVGMIDSNYQHACGDYDYGFRVRAAGYPLLVIPGSVGICTRNALPDRDAVCALSITQRWKRITGPKLFPLRAWFTYTFRHTGPLWPVFFVRPYVEVLFPRLFRTLH